MEEKAKTVLYLNLEKRQAVSKIHTDLISWVGGLGLALKLLEQNPEGSPLILAVGPLTAAFPFMAKTAAVFRSPYDRQLRETYIGGKFGALLTFAGLDAIVLTGKARRSCFITVEDDKIDFRTVNNETPLWLGGGLAGRSSVLSPIDGQLTADTYFHFSEPETTEVFVGKNLQALILSGHRAIPINDRRPYESLYTGLLNQAGNLPVGPGPGPSCFGCPLGCAAATAGEGPKTNFLAASLVSCQFARDLYGDVPRIFTCLEALGKTYHHEDLESLSGRIEILRKKLENA